MLSPVWAVFRRGEFIGTLPYKSDETAEQIEARCITWLRDLLNPLAPGAPPEPRAHRHSAH